MSKISDELIKEVKVTEVELSEIKEGRNAGDFCWIVTAGGIEPEQFNPIAPPRSNGRKFVYFLVRSITDDKGEKGQDPTLVDKMNNFWKKGVTINVATIQVETEPYYEIIDGEVVTAGGKPVSKSAINATVRVVKDENDEWVFYDDPKTQALSTISAYHVWVAEYDGEPVEESGAELSMEDMFKKFMASQAPSVAK